MKNFFKFFFAKNLTFFHIHSRPYLIPHLIKSLQNISKEIESQSTIEQICVSENIKIPIVLQPSFYSCIYDNVSNGLNTDGKYNNQIFNLLTILSQIQPTRFLLITLHQFKNRCKKIFKHISESTVSPFKDIISQFHFLIQKVERVSIPCPFLDEIFREFEVLIDSFPKDIFKETNDFQDFILRVYNILFSIRFLSTYFNQLQELYNYLGQKNISSCELSPLPLSDQEISELFPSMSEI